MNTTLFQDKIALVTGGGSGIGRALCHALAQAGAQTIIVADIHADKAQTVATQIGPQGHGHIVNISSASGLTPVPMGLPYATAKHAVVGLSTSLRTEAADLGVKVSVVCPGVIRTPIFDTAEEVTPLDRTQWLNSPMNQMMEPEDCARIILKGVARNKAIITVTAATKVMWWLNRLSPSLMDFMGRLIARQFRKMSAQTTG